MKINKKQALYVANAVTEARVHETPMELAKRLGLSPATVYSLATGNLRKLRSKTIEALDLNLGLKLQNIDSALPELNELQRQAIAMKRRLESAGLRSGTDRRAAPDRRMSISY